MRSSRILRQFLPGSSAYLISEKSLEELTFSLEADLKILWKYLVTHASALVLKYRQFLFEYSCAVVTARVYSLNRCLSVSGARANSSTDLDLFNPGVSGTLLEDWRTFMITAR
jgi:hypothetical protein